MNLQTLFDLKNRLEYCAVTGTSLIDEDFRLKRAIEAFSPLSAASPVFARIKAGCDALLCAPTEQRGAALLDVLGLVEAVAYTQGASGIQGELVPVPKSELQYLNVPYTSLSALKDDLVFNNPGALAEINRIHEEHPEYFSDRRVIEYTLKALSQPSSKLAEFAENRLSELSESIIPMLKKGFIPGGKAEMARRVRIIAKIGGEKENEWYRSILPESKKEIRYAVITALRCSRDNTALLAELCRKEKGANREAAMRSLAYMDSHEARAIWQDAVNKESDYIKYLKTVDSALSADLVSEGLREIIQKLLSFGNDDNNLKDLFLKWVAVMPGKYSESVRKLWLELLPDMAQLDAIEYDSNSGYGIETISVAERLNSCLLQCIERKPCEEFFALVRELHEKCPEHFAAAAFIADMLELSSEALYEKYAPCFSADYPYNPSVCLQLLNTFNRVTQSPEKGFFYELHSPNRMNDCFDYYRKPIPAPDDRWAALLTSPELRGLLNKVDIKKQHLYYGDFDRQISYFLNPASQEMRETFGKYFRKRIDETLDFEYFSEYYFEFYIEQLIASGWTEWDGLLSGVIKKKARFSCRSLAYLMEKIPASTEVKLREFSIIEAMMSSGEATHNGIGYIQMEQYRARLTKEQQH